MKKLLIYIFILALGGFLAWGLYSYIKDTFDGKEDPKIVDDGKDISKEEYIYKEDLLLLGYTISEIDLGNANSTYTKLNADLAVFVEKQYNTRTKHWLAGLCLWW